MVDKTIYYYKSRKQKEKANYDDEEKEDEDDDEDHNEMPWKGCFNVTVATVGAAPSAISSKAKVFQVSRRPCASNLSCPSRGRMARSHPTLPLSACARALPLMPSR